MHSNPSLTTATQYPGASRPKKPKFYYVEIWNSRARGSDRTAIPTPQADMSSKSFNQMLLNGQALHQDSSPPKKMSRDTRSGMSSVSNLSPTSTREKSHTISYNFSSKEKKKEFNQVRNCKANGQPKKFKFAGRES